MEKRGDVNPAYTPDLDRPRPRRPAVAPPPPEAAIEKLASQGVQRRAEEELRRAVEGR